MGEEKWPIMHFGSPALDDILDTPLPTRRTLFEELGIPYIAGDFILFAQHPYFEGGESIRTQITESLEALASFDLPVVAIYPNADPGGREIIRALEQKKNDPRFHLFRNVSHVQYLALEREAGVMVGNSSSGLIEAIAFKTPVVSVGKRQLGRERGDNVIEVPGSRKHIRRAIEKSLYDPAYITKLRRAQNPWGKGGVGKRVVTILEKLRIDEKLLVKR